MKQTRIIIAIVAIVAALYFFMRRWDIIREAFTMGINNVPFGQLLLPIILLVLGIVLLTIKKKDDEA